MIKLYPHQEEAVEWMTRTENRTRMVHEQPHGGILAHTMGLGKTISMLSLIKSQPEGRTLVVCPKSLLSQWQREAGRVFEAGDGCRVCIYHGIDRDLAAPPCNAIILTTFDIVRIEARRGKSLLRGTQWDRVVLDEAHRICEQSSKTSKAIQALRARNRWCITGTPFKNGMSDLMALSRFLMISPYCNLSWWRTYGQSVSKLHEWRDLFMHIRDKSELASLPPIKSTKIKVVLGERERALYESLSSTDLSCVTEAAPDQHELLRILRKRQATNHPILTTSPAIVSHSLAPTTVEGCRGCGGSSTTGACDGSLHMLCHACHQGMLCPGCIMEALPAGGPWVHSAKTQALWGYLRDCARVTSTSTKVVLFSQWTSCLDLIGSMLDHMGVGSARYDGRITSTEERDEVIDTFKLSEDCKVLLTSLGAGGEGVNLTFATHVILMEPYWNLAVEQQAIDRLHRIGQTQTTHVARFCVEDSIEDWVVDIQTRKTGELHRLLFGTSAVKKPVCHIRPGLDVNAASYVGLGSFLRCSKKQKI